MYQSLQGADSFRCLQVLFLQLLHVGTPFFWQRWLRITGAHCATCLKRTPPSTFCVIAPDAITSFRYESWSCRGQWDPLVRCGGERPRKWLVHARQLAAMLAFYGSCCASAVFGYIRLVWRALVKRLAASDDHRTLHNTARSAAMTSRPLASNTRLNTAPILPARSPGTGSFAVTLTGVVAYLFWERPTVKQEDRIWTRKPGEVRACRPGAQPGR